MDESMRSRSKGAGASGVSETIEMQETIHPLVSRGCWSVLSSSLASLFKDVNLNH